MKVVNRIIAIAVSLSLFFQQTGFAQLMPDIGVPAYLNGYIAPDKFRPVQLRSIEINPAANDLNLYLDKGDAKRLNSQEAEKTAQTFLEYLRIGIALPNNTFWVNLRPDSQDRIMDSALERTDLGKVLLEADLQLKKDLAKFTSPDTREGRQYWDKLYAKAQQLFGESEISIPTATRPWIVPGEIIMRQSPESAYIYKASLNVKLEQDWLTKEDSRLGVDMPLSSDKRIQEINSYSSELVRTLILPKLTAEVNSSKKYASLRQVYYALILAQWYKRQYRGQKGTYSGQIDSRDLSGLTSKNNWSKKKYFDAYQRSFAKGEYNKEEMVPAAGGMTVRQYFSGGAFMGNTEHALAAPLFNQANPSLTNPLIGYSASSGSVMMPVVNNIGVPALADGGTKVDDAQKTGEPSFLSNARAALDREWLIANHLFMAFHVAFISSLLSLPAGETFNFLQVLQFVFASPETPISAMFLYITWHTAIALHEMGHYLKAVKTSALKPELLKAAQEKMNQPLLKRLAWYAEMFVKIPWGKFEGVLKSAPESEAKGKVAQIGGKIRNFFVASFHPDAPFNLAVSAEGPAFSFKVARIALPVAIALVVGGLIGKGLTGDIVSLSEGVLYVGRMVLGVGIVTLLDRFFADPGKYKEFQERERKAAEKAKEVQAKMATGDVKPWKERMPEVMAWMLNHRIQEGTLNGMPIRAPYGWRNSGMGGRHTEKEYPKSNISMQELMFIPLTAKTYEEAQQITVELQNRLMQIIEKAEGATVMGIGLEGGLATYIQKEKGDRIPERRLYRFAKQAIIDIGKLPGYDVVLGIDPANSELEIAYREKYDQPEAVGMYLFWRDEDQTVMSRDELADEIAAAIEEDIPIISVEDLFAEDDYEGWRNWMARYGHMMFVIADDIATTKDSTVEMIADEGLANTLLTKANQIGSLSETMLAMLTARGKKMWLVISHRSKSPNDDMEAQIAISVDAEGLKAGGGANTERLVKYGAIIQMMKEAIRQKDQGQQMVDKELEDKARELIPQLQVTRVIAYEEATNAGIPTVGVKVSVGVKGSKTFENLLEFTGSTPLGTSAGTGEAIHLVDSIIQPSELTQKYADLFSGPQSDKTFRFKKDVNNAVIQSKNDAALSALFKQAQRYGGKGTQNAVSNVEQILSKLFVGKKVSEINSIFQIDQMLLNAELELGIQRGKISKDASTKEKIEFMQRKGELGMNAILSMSLALGRMAGAIQGKELWQLMREEMSRTIAATIAPSEEKSTEDILKENTFHQLVEKLKVFEEQRKARGDQKKLFEYLREGLPVYAAVNADGGTNKKGEPIHGMRYNGMAKLLAKIKDAVQNSDSKALDGLREQLVYVQQDTITVAFAIKGHVVIANPIGTLNEALKVVDAFKKVGIPSIMTGFQIEISFEDAKKGLEEGNYVAALLEIMDLGHNMVLYPTKQGLVNLVNDSGDMKGLWQQIVSNADGGNLLSEAEITKLLEDAFSSKWSILAQFMPTDVDKIMNFNHEVIPQLSSILKDKIDVEIAVNLIFEGIRVKIEDDGGYAKFGDHHAYPQYEATIFEVEKALELVNDPETLRKLIDLKRGSGVVGAYNIADLAAAVKALGLKTGGAALPRDRVAGAWEKQVTGGDIDLKKGNEYLSIRSKYSVSIMQHAPLFGMRGIELLKQEVMDALEDYKQKGTDLINQEKYEQLLVLAQDMQDKFPGNYLAVSFEALAKFELGMDENKDGGMTARDQAFYKALVMSEYADELVNTDRKVMNGKAQLRFLNLLKTFLPVTSLSWRKDKDSLVIEVLEEIMNEELHPSNGSKPHNYNRALMSMRAAMILAGSNIGLQNNNFSTSKFAMFPLVKEAFNVMADNSTYPSQRKELIAAAKFLIESYIPHDIRGQNFLTLNADEFNSEARKILVATMLADGGKMTPEEKSLYRAVFLELYRDKLTSEYVQSRLKGNDYDRLEGMLVDMEPLDLNPNDDAHIIALVHDIIVFPLNTSNRYMLQFNSAKLRYQAIKIMLAYLSQNPNLGDISRTDAKTYKENMFPAFAVALRAMMVAQDEEPERITEAMSLMVATYDSTFLQAQLDTQEKLETFGRGTAQVMLEVLREKNDGGKLSAEQYALLKETALNLYADRLILNEGRSENGKRVLMYWFKRGIANALTAMQTIVQLKPFLSPNQKEHAMLDAIKDISRNIGMVQDVTGQRENWDYMKGQIALLAATFLANNNIEFTDDMLEPLLPWLEWRFSPIPGSKKSLAEDVAYLMITKLDPKQEFLMKKMDKLSEEQLEAITGVFQGIKKENKDGGTLTVELQALYNALRQRLDESQQQPPAEMGGVDFRAMPAALQPVDPAIAAMVNPVLAKAPLQDLDKKWSAIRNSIKKSEVPYSELKEYVAVCKCRQDAGKQLEQVQVYIGELLKLEEERAVPSTSQMREIVGLIG